MEIKEAIQYITHHAFISDDVKDMAIEALEKQVPKKVNNYEKACDIYGDCPTCGQWYSFEKGNPFNYCPECGQALDWKVEE